MVQLVSRPEYVIDDLPGFSQYRFFESSASDLALPASIAFAKERDAVLQSAREAWAFRISAKGALESNKYQSTRTAAIGVKINGEYHLAFDDSDDPAENILLAQEGYDAHQSANKWLLPKNDPIIKGMLSRAEKGRMVPAPFDCPKLSTTPGPDGTSAYGKHYLSRAILGNDLAEKVAVYLRNKNHGTGYLWALSPVNLAQLGVDDNHVEVRRVGVGGGYGSSINDLDAGVRCNGTGRARGVRKTSTGNQGS